MLRRHPQATATAPRTRDPVHQQRQRVASTNSHIQTRSTAYFSCSDPSFTSSRPSHRHRDQSARHLLWGPETFDNSVRRGVRRSRDTEPLNNVERTLAKAERDPAERWTSDAKQHGAGHRSTRARLEAGSPEIKRNSTEINQIKPTPSPPYPSRRRHLRGPGDGEPSRRGNPACRRRRRRRTSLPDPCAAPRSRHPRPSRRPKRRGCSSTVRPPAASCISSGTGPTTPSPCPARDPRLAGFVIP